MSQEVLTVEMEMELMMNYCALMRSGYSTLASTSVAAINDQPLDFLEATSANLLTSQFHDSDSANLLHIVSWSIVEPRNIV